MEFPLQRVSFAGGVSVVHGELHCRCGVGVLLVFSVAVVGVVGKPAGEKFACFVAGRGR